VGNRTNYMAMTSLVVAVVFRFSQSSEIEFECYSCRKGLGTKG